MDSRPIVIIGSGISGLTAALRLEQTGHDCVLLEQGTTAGGRVATDEVEGFKLDRGFQVLQTSYPLAKQWLDFTALKLKAFPPGSLSHMTTDGGRPRFARMSDPWRDPGHLLSTALSPAATLADKFRVARLRADVLRPADPATLLCGPQRSTAEELAARKFSPTILRRFFQPFFGAVLLDPELTTDARFFLYCFRMFATGEAVLPANGMSAIPQQMRSRLQRTTFLANSRVIRVQRDHVLLNDGSNIDGRAVIIAAPADATAEMLGLRPPKAEWRSLTTLYFADDRPITAPDGSATLMLDGDGSGPINHVAPLSAAQPAYAPPGGHLVSATTFGVPAADDAKLEQSARVQLTRWLGPRVQQWRYLRTYRIRQALPALTRAPNEPWARPARHAPGIYLAGDQLDSPSLQGAMASGLHAAEACMEDFRRG